MSYSAKDLKIQFAMVPSSSLHHVKGGPALALLRMTKAAVFFVVLSITVRKGEPDEKHAVVYRSGMQLPGYEQYHGAIIDNYARMPVKLVGPEDVVDAAAARAVFDSLFSAAMSVKVEKVFELRACM
jgi:hypothetical protein